MKTKRMILWCAAVLAGFLLSAFISNRAVIFQRGNPIPYLIAAVQISEDRPYVAVDEEEGIYISKQGECPELFADFEEKMDVRFAEQAGSGYIFTNETDHYVISSEIYWGRYTVWMLSGMNVF